MFIIKDFKLKSGCISNNGQFKSIYAQKVTISGGTSNSSIQAKDTAISGGSFTNLFCSYAYISGGTINNISAANIAVSGKVTIGKYHCKNE